MDYGNSLITSSLPSKLISPHNFYIIHNFIDRCHHSQFTLTRTSGDFVRSRWIKIALRYQLQFPCSRRMSLINHSNLFWLILTVTSDSFWTVRSLCPLQADCSLCENETYQCFLSPVKCCISNSCLCFLVDISISRKKSDERLLVT